MKYGVIIVTINKNKNIKQLKFNKFNYFNEEELIYPIIKFGVV